MDQRRTTQPGFHGGSSRSRGEEALPTKLVICDSEGNTSVLPLDGSEVTVGRSEANTLCLDERNVSRRHARFFQVQGTYHVEDLASSNGSLVNGNLLEGPRLLEIGDEVLLGDYRIVYREERHDGSPVEEDHAIEVDVDAPAPTILASSPTLTIGRSSGVTVDEAQYGRLVMLSAPAPGAEFILTKATTLLGRFEESDIWINHPSISREHARVVRKDGKYEIVDLSSSNGVRINQETTAETELREGDELELGEVRFRFVAPGEHFTFVRTDSGAFDAHDFTNPWPKRLALIAFLGVIAFGLYKAYAFVPRRWYASWLPGAAATRANDTASETRTDPSPASEKQTNGVAREPTTTFAAALRRCKAALRSDDIEAAISHGEYALALQPGNAEATACRDTARDRRSENEIFARGLQAAKNGDQIAAYFAFEELPRTSPFREREEVAAAMEAFAEYHLRLAKDALRDDGAEALRHADMVLAMVSPSKALRKEANRIRTVAASRPSAEGSRNKARQRRRNGGRDSSRDRASRDRGAAARKAARTESSSLGSKAACSPIRPDYSECIVRTLRGKARRPNELSLLIESYRQLGRTGEAKANMRRFIDRFPTHRLAAHYQRILLRM